MVFEGVIAAISNVLAHPIWGSIVTLAILSIIIILYSVFVFYFYRFLAKKNILELNLRKYNTYSMGPFLKIIPVILYILEYIIILPILTFFWYAVLSLLVFVLADQLTLDLVFLITAGLVTSVRVTSYISENLSQDLAKMLPFTLLGIAITNPTFLDIGTSLSRLGGIESFFTSVLYYMGFIIAVEFFMRIVDLFRNIAHEAKAIKEGIDE